MHVFYGSNVADQQSLHCQVWEFLMPQEQLVDRYTSQWQKIGFQGKDPSTDFRAMGLLALDDLHYLCKYYPDISARILAASHHPSSWFSFAIVGINITAYALRLVRTRFLQYTFYKYGVSEDNYHEVYCFLFDGFEKFWTSQKKTPSILDFTNIFREFQMKVENDILELNHRCSMLALHPPLRLRLHRRAPLVASSSCARRNKTHFARALPTRSTSMIVK
ncbi:ELMO/CED-12 family-domain-containing protein [Entophlyctis helioformis]|nr:ELMO/CED-12 family-domain-containing protein [Entophlyctis helioformis]